MRPPVSRALAFRRSLTAAVAGLMLAVTACTGSTTREAAAPPTAVASTPIPPTAVATAPAPPTVGPTQQAAPATAQPTPASQPAAAEAARPADGGVRLSLVPEASEARYRAREQLAGRSLPNDAVGSTRSVGGEIVLDPSGAILAEQSRIVVDLRSLRSDESRRDNFIQRNTLQTDRFPTAEFVPREAPGLPIPLPASGQAAFQLVGELTVHGVARPATWEATASFGEQEVAGTAVTRVKMTDFGMTPPRVGPVLSLEDELTLELDFRAARSG